MRYSVAKLLVLGIALLGVGAWMCYLHFRDDAPTPQQPTQNREKAPLNRDGIEQLQKALEHTKEFPFSLQPRLILAELSMALNSLEVLALSLEGDLRADLVRLIEEARKVQESTRQGIETYEADPTERIRICVKLVRDAATSGDLELADRRKSDTTKLIEVLKDKFDPYQVAQLLRNLEYLEPDATKKQQAEFALKYSKLQLDVVEVAPSNMVKYELAMADAALREATKVADYRDVDPIRQRYEKLKQERGK